VANSIVNSLRAYSPGGERGVDGSQAEPCFAEVNNGLGSHLADVSLEMLVSYQKVRSSCLLGCQKLTTATHF
jgi:hypothetical protein